MLLLPTYDNRLECYQLMGQPLSIRAPKNKQTRIAFAAAHVVSNPLTERNPWNGRPSIDWEKTLLFRENLWDQGFGLAEAMDTAQRGMGVDWLTAKTLIQRTMVAARQHPLNPRVACGAGTDHIDLSALNNEEAIIAAYETQMEAIEASGGQIILMASRALPAINANADQYLNIYGRLLTQAKAPVILHWLGDVFDSQLSGYWGSKDISKSSNIVLSLIEDYQKKIDGIKISLLNEEHELEFRARLPKNVHLYTGDDFNYTSLIEGDSKHFSQALLGIFAAIAPAASQALDALAEGDRVKYHKLLDPTVALSREIFKAPTCFYKAGIVFLAWLNGMQEHFIMPMGLQSAREIVHYAEVYRLADRARLLLHPELAEQRMKALLITHGIQQR